MHHVRSYAAAVLCSLVLLAAGGTAAADPASPGSPLVGGFCSEGAAIQSTGASFANNAHQLVFIPAYNSLCDKGSVTYTSTGSGAGKTAALNRTHAFGGSDEPLALDEELAYVLDLGCDPVATPNCSPNPQNRVSPLHHIPIALGAVTVAVNLNSCGIDQEQLNLRGPAIAAVFAGLVTSWNDPLLSAENPALASCGLPIRLAVRADVSGTTYVFKDYLSKRTPLFWAYKQSALNLAWPAEDLGRNTPLRGSGNGGVAAVVKATDGAIGYVELSTAMRNGLTWAKPDGASGVFNSPRTGTAANCDLAALGATPPPSTLLPGWDLVSVTDTPNPLAYSICSVTYALVYNNLHQAYPGMTRAQAQTLVDYLAVAVDDAGQAGLPSYGYGKLPPNLQAEAKAGLASVFYL